MLMSGVILVAKPAFLFPETSSMPSVQLNHTLESIHRISNISNTIIEDGQNKTELQNFEPIVSKSLNNVSQIVSRAKRETRKVTPEQYNLGIFLAILASVCTAVNGICVNQLGKVTTSVQVWYTGFINLAFCILFGFSDTHSLLISGKVINSR